MTQKESFSSSPNIDWESIVVELTAFAHYLVGRKSWFRGKIALPKGYEPIDLAVEAITKYLESPEKFDRGRSSDLIKYLKWNLLRRLVHNLSISGDNKYNQDFKSISDHDGSDFNLTFEERLPFVEYYFDSNIDLEILLKEIETELQGNEELELVFIALYYEQSKRSEVYKDLNIKSSEYDNRLKRLKRIVQKVMNKYSIINQ